MAPSIVPLPPEPRNWGCNDPAGPVDTRNADVVVPDTTDCPTAVGPMSVSVHRVGVVVVEVVSMDIIDVAVAIIILAVARNFAWVGPDVRHEIRVGVIDARINYCNNEFLVARVLIPCLRGADLIHAVEVSPQGIIRNRIQGVHDVDRLDVPEHVTPELKSLEGLFR